MNYVDPAALKLTLSLDGFTYADADIDIAVSAASRWVDTYTNRRYWLDPDPVARTYDPAGAHWTMIDDLAEPVTIEQAANGTYEPLEGYELLPLNASLDDEPYTMLTGATGIVRLTGRYGWPQVPAPVTQATGLVAARLLKRSREAPFGIAGFSMEGAAVRIAPVDPDVASLLNQYVRPQRAAVA